MILFFAITTGQYKLEEVTLNTLNVQNVSTELPSCVTISSSSIATTSINAFGVVFSVDHIMLNSNLAVLLYSSVHTLDTIFIAMYIQEAGSLIGDPKYIPFVAVVMFAMVFSFATT